MTLKAVAVGQGAERAINKIWCEITIFGRNNKEKNTFFVF